MKSVADVFPHSPRHTLSRALVLLGGLAALVAGLQPQVAQAEAVSAQSARAALARGAVAWDIRPAADYRAGHLPGAVQAAPALLATWEGEASLAALEQAVSAAGVDLSREVVVYGEPGDVRAQALYDALKRVAPGRVHWLVGGAVEWSLSGAALSREDSVRRPVPQRLVVQDVVTDAPVRMAADALRRSHAWARTEVAWLEARAD